MTIKELLTHYNISQEQLSRLTGIPRGRISMWVSENKDTPPKADDAKIMNLAASFLANHFKPEAVKSLIDNYVVVDGMVKSRDGMEFFAHVDDFTKPYGATDPTPIVKEASAPYNAGKTQSVPQWFKDNPDTLYNMLQTIITTNERISITNAELAKTNSNYDATIQLLTATNQKLVDTNAQLVNKLGL